MKTRCRIVILLSLFSSLLTGCRQPSSSLEALDELIEEHQPIYARYQAHLDSLYLTSLMPMTDEERFAAYGQLFDGYRAFNIDSQLVYVDKRIALAARLSSPAFTQVAQLNRAEVLMRSGMYFEAKECLDGVARQQVATEWRPYYFHLRRTLYGLMEDFAITPSDRTRYHRWTQTYRDSFLTTQTCGSFYHVLVHSDALAAGQQNDEALALLAAYENEQDMTMYEQGLFAITRAQIYAHTGQRDEQKEQLIIASMADLRGAVREYVALRELARILYEEGDTDRAYRYIHCAVEDAKAGGMRGRASEMSTIYLIIESAYLRQETIHKQLLYGLLASIVCIAALLFAFSVYYARQHARLAALNARLHSSNEQLQQSDQIKAIYVGRYMESSSQLIERFDNWRKNLHQYLKNQDMKHLQAEISSQRFTQEQLNAFYRDFDDSFLHIFPDFVEKVKTLLVDDAELRIKPGERLNTDLRVLCCIRLGITDSTQIASFLRYSLSTIYNSRTHMRNLAKGDRDSFEQKVATL